ncbi:MULTISPECIES: hypothetical protein [Streptomyces]|uniref:Uncharacterized protein n=1 Tax=Streptomyces luteosporeus TaxID=173856 RepID=A0ABN3TSK7_9ACTN
MSDAATARTGTTHETEAHAPRAAAPTGTGRHRGPLAPEDAAAQPPATPHGKHRRTPGTQG